MRLLHVQLNRPTVLGYSVLFLFFPSLGSPWFALLGF